MDRLRDTKWMSKYDSDDGNLLELFYIPAVSCAVHYDRSTGFFSADVLVAASTAVEDLVRRNGHMRLVVGCTLEQDEVDAIRKGEELRNIVDQHLDKETFEGLSEAEKDGLELLAWMVKHGFLEVKVAIPCDSQRNPVQGISLHHEKAGIIEDKNGDKLAFNGSLNETIGGWERNWESFHAFTSWDDAKHLEEEVESFQKLWDDKSRKVRVIDLGEAARRKLLDFLPDNDGIPHRLITKPDTDTTPPPPVIPVPEDEFKKTWDYIRSAPAMSDGGELVGEATSAVVPWPHQVYAFDRMYSNWPPRLLIADEVGLGKTVQAGLLLRQAWLSGRAKRILVLAPKAVLRQWQLELREKFNLNWPIYGNGKLTWCQSPAFQKGLEKPVEGDEWLREPFVLASSQLFSRKNWGEKLLKADPWDIVVLDEAHHARRSGTTIEKASPNNLLRFMRKLKNHTSGLILLTATPMQVDPAEVWDLLDLLDLPQEWDVQSFLKFFDDAASDSPDAAAIWRMAELFRASERKFGEMHIQDAVKFTDGDTFLARKLLRKLHEEAMIPYKSLSFEEKALAVRIMKAWSPTKKLISRHTRELLRKYHAAGKISSNIAVRMVYNELVELSETERGLYEEVEDYISTTYNKASMEKRQAVGFIMTTYRKRLASSFYSLRMTLQHRLDSLKGMGSNVPEYLIEEDVSDDELRDERQEKEEAAVLEKQEDLLQNEEDEIGILLQKIGRLPDDSKAVHLLKVLGQIHDAGYGKAVIFTQFTDTLDFLRDRLTDVFGPDAVLCYSGRGGERCDSGSWMPVSREKTKSLFKNEEEVKILLCTDAAAEGLNFQFCGAIVNYDMPWNPMKVEQRIGRIDRLGQQYKEIVIYNLMYKDTVETDVFLALKDRINLFTSFVGNLQPIVSNMPKVLRDIILKPRELQASASAQAVSGFDKEITDAEEQSFNIDDDCDNELELPNRPKPKYDLGYLNWVLTSPELKPRDVRVKAIGSKDFSYTAPGLNAIRVTTDPKYYSEHSESVELWSPGSPVFPWDKEE